MTFFSVVVQNKFARRISKIEENSFDMCKYTMKAFIPAEPRLLQQNSVTIYIFLIKFS